MVAWISRHRSERRCLPYAPRTTAYYGYDYLLVEAGPEQASSWREADPFKGALPDLMFPADRSWLLSTMWDDDWTSRPSLLWICGDDRDRDQIPPEHV
jgi:hypothetical protein